MGVARVAWVSGVCALHSAAESSNTRAVYELGPAARSLSTSVAGLAQQQFQRQFNLYR